MAICLLRSQLLPCANFLRLPLMCYCAIYIPTQFVNGGIETPGGGGTIVPPSTLCAPQLQSTCQYIVNHYVKILHVRLGGANNMRPLSWGGGGHKRKRSSNLFRLWTPPLPPSPKYVMHPPVRLGVQIVCTHLAGGGGGGTNEKHPVNHMETVCASCLPWEGAQTS